MYDGNGVALPHSTDNKYLGHAGCHATKRVHFLFAFQGVDEEHVGTGIGKGRHPPQRLVQAGRLAGVGAGHQHDVITGIPVGGC